MVWTQESRHKDVNYDHPGDCNSEKDCLRWHWLKFRQPERKSNSQSSKLWNVSAWHKCLVVDLIGQRSRDVIGRLSVSRDVIGCEDCKVIGAPITLLTIVIRWRVLPCVHSDWWSTFMTMWSLSGCFIGWCCIVIRKQWKFFFARCITTYGVSRSWPFLGISGIQVESASYENGKKKFNKKHEVWLY